MQNLIFSTEMGSNIIAHSLLEAPLSWTPGVFLHCIYVLKAKGVPQRGALFSCCFPTQPETLTDGPLLKGLPRLPSSEHALPYPLVSSSSLLSS